VLLIKSIFAAKNNTHNAMKFSNALFKVLSPNHQKEGFGGGAREAEVFFKDYVKNNLVSAGLFRSNFAIT